MANATRNERYTQAALHGENDGVHHFQLKRDLWQETCATTSGNHFGIKRGRASPIAFYEDFIRDVLEIDDPLLRQGVIHRQHEL